MYVSLSVERDWWGALDLPNRKRERLIASLSQKCSTLSCRGMMTILSWKGTQSRVSTSSSSKGGNRLSKVYLFAQSGPAGALTVVRNPCLIPVLLSTQPPEVVTSQDSSQSLRLHGQFWETSQGSQGWDYRKPNMNKWSHRALEHLYI